MESIFQVKKIYQRMIKNIKGRKADQKASRREGQGQTLHSLNTPMMAGVKGVTINEGYITIDNVHIQGKEKMNRMTIVYQPRETILISMNEVIMMIENKGRVRETEIEKINTNGNKAIEMTGNTKKIMMTEMRTETITEIATNNSDVAIQVIIAEMTVQVDLPTIEAEEITKIDTTMIETTFLTSNTSVTKANPIRATKPKNLHKPKSQLMKGIIDFDTRFLHFLFMQ